ncbi:MAG TPA: hypothetical protein VIG51_07060 [Candidatus Baltobacteraceae bacterium]|jgi:hypothetical protein
MDALEARDHLEMVDRILAQAERGTSAATPWLYIVWGIVGAVLDACDQLVLVAHYPPRLFFFSGACLLVAIGVTVAYGIRLRRMERVSTFERQIGRVFWAASIAAMVVEIGAGHLFPGWAAAAIWSVVIAVPLLFVGLQGHRVTMSGGVVLLASVVAANFVPANLTGYVLAAGMLVGLTGSGIAFAMLSRK